jgi:hypothetical protein
MDDLPPRFKSEQELSAEQHLQRLQAEARGEPPPEFENPEYARRRADVLRAAGFTDEAEASTADVRPLDEMSADDHYNELRGGA